MVAELRGDWRLAVQLYPQQRYWYASLLLNGWRRTPGKYGYCDWSRR
jgi:hypothetical protein